MTEAEIIDGLLGSLAENVSNSPGLLLPVSGGSDGAFTLWLCHAVCPQGITAVYYGSQIRGESWFQTHGSFEYVSLPDIAIDAEAFRWAMTASTCLQRKLWPVGSRNRTENVLRTYRRTSLLATVLPIVGIWTSDVMKLARYVGVPEEILRSSRVPDPACGRPKELTDIGIEKIDAYLQFRLGLLDENVLLELDVSQREYLEEVWEQNVFKTKLPLRGPQLSLDLP